MRKASWIGALIVVSGVVSGTARADLVTNGGFETGDFTGWGTVAAPAGSDFRVIPYNPHSGTYAAIFGDSIAGNYDQIYQNLGTTAGTEYQVSFWLANLGSGMSDFQAYWDGTEIFDALNSGPFGYTEYTFDVTASTSSTQLLFQAYQLPSFFYLDDVSVTDDLTSAPVPLPPSAIALGFGMLLPAIRILGQRMAQGRRQPPLSSP